MRRRNASRHESHQNVRNHWKCFSCNSEMIFLGFRTETCDCRMSHAESRFVDVWPHSCVCLICHWCIKRIIFIRFIWFHLASRSRFTNVCETKSAKNIIKFRSNNRIIRNRTKWTNCTNKFINNLFCVLLIVAREKKDRRKKERTSQMIRFLEFNLYLLGVFSVSFGFRLKRVYLHRNLCYFFFVA